MEKKKQVYSSLYSKMTLNMLLIKDFSLFEVCVYLSWLWPENPIQPCWFI